MTEKNKKNLVKSKTNLKASKKPQTNKKSKTKKDNNVKSIIETLEKKVKEKKINSKDIVDKALLVIMIAQLLFLVYYFLGY